MAKHEVLGRSLRTASLLALLCIAPSACGPDASKPQGGSTTADAIDSSSDTATVDGANADDANADDAQDTTADAGADSTSCNGAAGCPCTGPNDCQSALCLETTVGLRCSAYCGDGLCPDGWECKGQKGGADATYFCTPAGGLLCRPCTFDTDCEAAGNLGARCVDYGDSGGFCGLACLDDTGCPSGHSCRDVPSVAGGVTSNQCVVTKGDDLGACGCSPYASEAGLATTCWSSSGSGAEAKRCKGSRKCDETGEFTACALLSGDQAVCLQSQCLNAESHLPLADGTSCDDGRACTQVSSCSAGVCVSDESSSNCACEPGIKTCPQAGASNLCLGPLTCTAQPAGAAAAFACEPNATLHVVCDDSSDGPCEKNACAPATGLCDLAPIERTQELCDVAGGGCRRQWLPTSAPDATATPCDDGLACSTNDLCTKGACEGNMAACGCVKDADCVDDGDKCNGTPYCNTAGANWTCAVNPATVVVCDTTSDSGCQATECVLATGACKKQNKPAGAPCDDGVTCTTGDVCASGGSCTPGTWTCCKSDADCAGEEDGDVCNGTLFCNKAAGSCNVNPATKVVCPTVGNTECHVLACQPVSGQCEVTATNDGGACDDGDACTPADSCVNGSCKPGNSVCACQKDADCVSQDDGNLCNGTLYCHPSAGPNGTSACVPNPSTAISCQTIDDTTCLRTLCLAKTGSCAKVATASGAPCDADGTACTANDACDGAGSCKLGKAVCACTDDADCVGKDDGNLCNGTLFCDKTGPSGFCRLNPASVKTCPAGNDTPCQKNLCQPATGTCSFAALTLGTACDDGDPCTGGDICNGKGDCSAGGDILCACVDVAGCAAFDDADVCNGSYDCVDKQCVFSGVALDCADGNPCTTDSCDAKAGCKHAPIADCTACKTNTDCDDGNVCTADACSGAAGSCTYVPVTQACNDGNACTVGDTCAAGLCKGGSAKACDDGNVCTTDSCNSKTGCVYKAVANNSVDCDDPPSGICTSGACACRPGTMSYPITSKTGSKLACGAIGPHWGSLPLSPNSLSLKTYAGVSVVVDSKTKLMWERQPASEVLIWKQSTPKCQDLDTAGFDDWRIPTRAELESLTDFSVKAPGPMLSSLFILPDASIDTWALEKVGTWPYAANSANGVLAPHHWNVPAYRRCVRNTGGFKPIWPRFAKAVYPSPQSDVVTDKWTWLQWEVRKVKVPISAANAASTCGASTAGGKGDWRVPNVRELSSIIDAANTPAVDKTAFSAIGADKYWASGAAVAGASSVHWTVDFNDGANRPIAANATALILCVRGPN